MVTKTVSLKDFAKELKQFNGDHLDNLRKATFSGIAKSLPEVIKNSPVDTGQYASSWDFSIGEHEALFGNFAPHAPIIEIGARPFTPPIRPLLEWAKRVLQDPSQPPDFSDRVWALAKGTQKKISEVGMQPKHIMENSIPLILKNIKEEMERMR